MAVSPETQTAIDNIIEKIFSLNSPDVADTRKEQIENFIKLTVNGDDVKKYLSFTATLSKDRMGVLIYILTNLRLIKIDIDAQEVNSSIFPLKTFIGMERKLVDGDRASVEASFENGSVGLRFSSNNQEIVEFFQSVDQSGREMCADE